MHVRVWTTPPAAPSRPVVVLHGGPGAPGSAAPLARGLADTFAVLEPFQRGSGAEPLTVARHVSDLGALVRARCAAPPALVGWSWGAMLALAYAAAAPGEVASLALVGCGTFDRAARDEFEATVQRRLGAESRAQLERLAQSEPDPDRRLARMAELVLPAYSYEPDPDAGEIEHGGCDGRAHAQTWTDLVRLQDAGTYPAAFAAIDAPVLMLHGAHDPHPGELVRASLAPHVARLEYVELERCGHYPWLERHAREPFFTALRAWLAR